METLPMPLDGLRQGPGGLDEFRISAPREVAAMLRQLCDGSVPLHLNAGDGAIAGTIWTLDAARGSLGFSIDAHDAGLAALLEAPDVVVVGYLDNVKLQFDVHDLMLVRSERASVLNCSYPRELYRFQRRNAFRVRPPLRQSPVARLRHTDIAEMQLSLRVVDLSIGGCALFLPDDVPTLQVGGVLNQVQIELDVDTRFLVDLRLAHVTAIHSQSRGTRLGCEFVRPDPATLRALQRFIDLAQKRGKLLSLD